MVKRGSGWDGTGKRAGSMMVQCPLGIRPAKVRHRRDEKFHLDRAVVSAILVNKTRKKKTFVWGSGPPGCVKNKLVFIARSFPAGLGGGPRNQASLQDPTGVVHTAEGRF